MKYWKHIHTHSHTDTHTSNVVAIYKFWGATTPTIYASINCWGTTLVYFPKERSSQFYFFGGKSELQPMSEPRSTSGILKAEFQPMITCHRNRTNYSDTSCLAAGWQRLATFWQESSPKAFLKAHKSRQNLNSRQNSLCWGPLLSKRSLTFWGTLCPCASTSANLLTYKM